MRTTIASLCLLGLVAGSAPLGCGSSNANRPDPNAEAREEARAREDAKDGNQALQKEEDKRDDAQSAEPNRR